MDSYIHICTFTIFGLNLITSLAYIAKLKPHPTELVLLIGVALLALNAFQDNVMCTHVCIILFHCKTSLLYNGII